MFVNRYVAESWEQTLERVPALKRVNAGLVICKHEDLEEVLDLVDTMDGYKLIQIVPDSGFLVPTFIFKAVY